MKVGIKTTDTGELKAIEYLVDCGATGEFIDRDYVKANRLRTRLLSESIPVFNIDGTPNEAGSISEVVDLILRYKNHLERALFAVTGLGKQNLVLGHSWLHKHNPEIDWATGEVKMSRCPPRCCSGCRDEVREERKVRKAEIRQIEICSAGPDPEMVTDCDDIPELEPDCEDDDEDDEVEEGDRLFAASILPCSASIQASSTISQRLAEVFKLNSQSGPTQIPDYLKEFEVVFSKKSFDVLPEPKQWDHAIELTL